MKFDIIALAVIAAAGAAALVACNWLLATYAPGLTPARLFMEPTSSPSWRCSHCFC